MRSKLALQTAPLTPDAAFVVHLRIESQADAKNLSGRVEHVFTGRQIEFESAAELCTFMKNAPCDPATGKPASGK